MRIVVACVADRDRPFVLSKRPTRTTTTMMMVRWRTVIGVLKMTTEWRMMKAMLLLLLLLSLNWVWTQNFGGERDDSNYQKWVMMVG